MSAGLRRTAEDELRDENLRMRRALERVRDWDIEQQDLAEVMDSMGLSNTVTALPRTLRESVLDVLKK